MSEQRTDTSAGALVEQAVHAVLGAEDHRLDIALDTSASMLAASAERWPDVSAALLAYASRSISSAWSSAWRPADLMRLVRRDLDPVTPVHTALATDLIAAENRDRAPESLDRRWLDQLAELGAEVWWAGDGEYLPGFAARHRLDRFALATAALEVLRVWAFLPRITPVGIIPGEDAQARHISVPLPGEPRMLSRIRALLAKAESTDFPEEAEALTAKAQELMARESIDEALLSAGRASKDVPGAVRIGVDAPYDGAKSMLLDAVAEANRCRAVWSQEFGFCTVVGFEADLDAVELLYTSLLVQATTAMQHAGDRRHRGGSRRTRAYRESFLVAYAGRIRDRLAEAAREAVAEVTAGSGDGRLLPVLAARGEAVDEAVGAMFPRLTSERVRIGDEAGYVAGQAAADRASL